MIFDILYYILLGQALRIVLSGKDIIGIAKTGSGKTAAFVLPMIVHIMDQPELAKEEGPIGVICAPTRELAYQILQPQAREILTDVIVCQEKLEAGHYINNDTDEEHDRCCSILMYSVEIKLLM